MTTTVKALIKILTFFLGLRIGEGDGSPGLRSNDPDGTYLTLNGESGPPFVRLAITLKLLLVTNYSRN